MPSYKINFSGLIGFVPNKEMKKAMVLLLDGKYRHRAPDGEELFPHFPFIHYNLEDLAEESSRRPDLTGRGVGLNLLSLEDLKIGEQTNDGLKFKLIDNPPEEPTHYGDDYDADKYGSRNLCWIMPIHRIGKLDGVSDPELEISEECLKDKYLVAKEENKLAARFKLSSGTLGVEDFHKNSTAGESLNTVCRFRGAANEDAHHSQVIATSVVYEPPMTNHRLRISSQRFDMYHDEKGGEFPDLLFKKPDDLKRDVVINIWNAPFIDILDLLGEKGKHEWEGPRGDRSFRSYFRLCRGKLKKLPVLTREERTCAKFQKMWSAYRDKNVGCPTARYPAADF